MTKEELKAKLENIFNHEVIKIHEEHDGYDITFKYQFDVELTALLELAKIFNTLNISVNTRYDYEEITEINVRSDMKFK